MKKEFKFEIPLPYIQWCQPMNMAVIAPMFISLLEGMWKTI